jgi:hypothetical protein
MTKKEKTPESKMEKKRKLDEPSQENEKMIVESSDDDDASDVVEAGTDKPKLTGKEVRAARRLEREKLLEEVPKTDEHGIHYTKQQLRRMRKRVARGLDPIETSREVHERLKSDAALRREEEEELAGMMHIKEDKAKDSDDEGGSDDDDDDDDDKDEEDEADKVDPFEAAKQAAGEEPKQKKKPRRTKPVPTDYVCSACKGRHEPSHWIYDCPSKITVRGTNGVAKDLRGIKAPDERKVFVSGLPFEVKVKDVHEIFVPCGKVSQCKLITFEDTGRCKGTAIITFETEDAAKKALKLSGTVVGNEATAPKKKGKDAPPEKKSKELRLKVTKVLNRTATKNK